MSTQSAFYHTLGSDLFFSLQFRRRLVEDIDPRFPEANQQIRKTPPVARRASGAFVSWLITDAGDDAPAATATVTRAASLNVGFHRNKE